MSIFWQILELFEKHRLQFTYINPPSEMHVLFDFSKKTDSEQHVVFLEIKGTQFPGIFLSSKHRLMLHIYFNLSSNLEENG